MASWGLGFEYGKKAYEEMRRTQEENDRYLAEHNLWETDLRTKEAVADATLAEAQRVSANSKNLTKYTDAILHGDYGAYADALSEMNPGKQYRHIGDGVIAEVDPKNPSMVLKGSTFSIKGKNPTALVSELHKFAEDHASITSYHREGVKDKEDKDHELKKLGLQNQNAKDVANIYAGATKYAAEMNAATKGLAGISGSSGSSGGKSSRINLSDTDSKYLDSTVAQTLFGSGASGVRSEDGSWTVYQKGVPVELSAEDARDLEEVHRAMIVGVSNLANTNSGSLRANIATLANMFGHQIRNNIDYEGARTKFVKDKTAYEKAQEASKKANSTFEVSGTLDLSNLTSEDREAIEDARLGLKDRATTLAAVGMPVWDEKTWGAFSENPRARTYGLVPLVQPSRKEPESKK